jgi:hypothetical protein
MEATWIWILVAAVGQAAYIVSVVDYFRAHPTASYPVWRSPAGQTRRGRVILALGTMLTLFGAFMTAHAVGDGWVRALIIVCCFVPALVVVVTINILATRRRARQAQTST